VVSRWCVDNMLQDLPASQLRLSQHKPRISIFGGKRVRNRTDRHATEIEAAKYRNEFFSSPTMAKMAFSQDIDDRIDNNIIVTLLPLTLNNMIPKYECGKSLNDLKNPPLSSTLAHTIITRHLLSLPSTAHSLDLCSLQVHYQS